MKFGIAIIFSSAEELNQEQCLIVKDSDGETISVPIIVVDADSKEGAAQFAKERVETTYDFFQWALANQDK